MGHTVLHFTKRRKMEDTLRHLIKKVWMIHNKGIWVVLYSIHAFSMFKHL